VATARSLVPTIDISGDVDDQLDALDAACREHGFFLLSGHGLDDVISETWVAARAFFDADRSVKLDVERDLDNPLGWNDRELTKRKRDHKEVFDFTDPTVDRSDAQNRWPTHPIGFRSTLAAFYDAFSDLSERAVDLVHRALEMEPSAGRRFSGERANSSVRLNHYTVGDPVPEAERGALSELGDTALGYHTDPGVLTLLLQDETGGLQTQGRNGEWIDVEPVAGTVVVNLADSVQVWTNDRYRAAVHRVLPMTSNDRISIPYFLHPSRDAVIEPIAELIEDQPRYRAFRWREFMRARTDDNYVDLGADDTQISDYSIR
jgi:isopenicillin N synthase-like dioxygenase